MRDAHQHTFTREIDSDKVYFNYRRAPYLLSKWLIFLSAFVSIALILAELLLNRSAYCLAFIVLASLYGLYLILKHKEGIDKATEAGIVDGLLENEVKRLTAGKNKLVAKEYFIICPKEGYRSEKRFMLVVLSNGKVYRYNVDLSEKHGFVLDKKATLCTDKSELELVRKYTDKLVVNRKARLKQITGRAAACVLAFGLTVIGVALWLGSKVSWMKIVALALFSVFVVSIITVMALDPYKDKGGLIGGVYKTALWLVQGLWLLIQLLLPSLLIIAGFVFIILLPGSILFVLLKHVSEYTAITPQTALFISLTFGAIVSAHYSKPLFGWLSALLTVNGHRNEKYFQELVEYVYQPANIQYVVFLLYVIYLIVMTVYRLQTGDQPFWGREVDLAVLESFLVFVAFTNMKTRKAAAKFDLSEMFALMYAMWAASDDMDDDE